MYSFLLCKPCSLSGPSETDIFNDNRVALNDNRVVENTIVDNRTVNVTNVTNIYYKSSELSQPGASIHGQLENSQGGEATFYGKMTCALFCLIKCIPLERYG